MASNSAGEKRKDCDGKDSQGSAKRVRFARSFDFWAFFGAIKQAVRDADHGEIASIVSAAEKSRSSASKEDLSYYCQQAAETITELLQRLTARETRIAELEATRNSSSSSSNAAVLEQQKREAEAEIRQLRAKIQNMAEKIKQNEPRNAELEEALAKATTNEHFMEVVKGQLYAEKAEFKRKFEELSTEQAELKRKFEEQSIELKAARGAIDGARSERDGWQQLYIQAENNLIGANSNNQKLQQQIAELKAAAKPRGPQIAMSNKAKVGDFIVASVSLETRVRTGEIFWIARHTGYDVQTDSDTSFTEEVHLAVWYNWDEDAKIYKEEPNSKAVIRGESVFCYIPELPKNLEDKVKLVMHVRETCPLSAVYSMRALPKRDGP